MDELRHTPYGWNMTFKAAVSWLKKAERNILERLEAIENDPARLMEVLEAKSKLKAVRNALRQLDP